MTTESLHFQIQPEVLRHVWNCCDVSGNPANAQQGQRVPDDQRQIDYVQSERRQVRAVNWRKALRI